MDSPTMPSIDMKARREGVGALTEEERWRWRLFQLGQFLRMDNNHYQYEQGFIDKSYYDAVTVQLVRANAPFWEELGILGRNNRPKFAAEIARIMAESD